MPHRHMLILKTPFLKIPLTHFESIKLRFCDSWHFLESSHHNNILVFSQVNVPLKKDLQEKEKTAM